MVKASNYPRWITPAQLPSDASNRNFFVNPLIIEFEAPRFTTVTQLNGTLPAGLHWTQSGQSVVITGESTEVAVETTAEITWRLTTRNGLVSDRSYNFVLEPIVSAPSWEGQPTFIGYASSTGTHHYKVTATTDTGLPIIYSFAQFAPPNGMTINAETGEITYVAPEVFFDQTIYFNLRATTGTQSSTLAVSIGLLYAPHAPAWITPAGLLATTKDGDFVEVVLEAYNNTDNPETYAILSSDPPFPFTLTPEGLLYGHAPIVTEDTTYVFTVVATNSLGNNYRRFEIIATTAIRNAPVVWNNTDPDLGDHLDGRYVVIDVGAHASNSAVEHTVVGGMLPRDLILDRTAGLLIGFLEFQTRDREYYFEIQARTPFETLIRRYRINVLRSMSHPSIDLLVPIEGPLRTMHREYQANLISTSWIPDGFHTPAALLEDSYVKIASGLSYMVDDPALALLPANLHLAPTNLMISNITNVAAGSNTLVYYNTVIDPAAGAEPYLYENSGTIFNVFATIAVRTGLMTLTVVKVGLDRGLIKGTKIRMVNANDQNMWMQGTVQDYVSNNLVVDFEQSSEPGYASAWNIVDQPAYPPSLVNIRRDLIPSLGWVNAGGGRGTVLLPNIDENCNELLFIQVLEPGTGYVTSPEIVIIGEGTGARAVANLTVTGVTLQDPGSGFTQGQIIELDPPAHIPATLTIDKVDGKGSIAKIKVLYGGEYERFPWGRMTLRSMTGDNAVVTFDVGIGPVTVLSSGKGYKGSTTSVTITGYEVLPSWQKYWFPYLNVGTVYKSKMKLLDANLTDAVKSKYYNRRWPMQHLVLRMQGLLWTGNTTFDNDFTSIDGDSTRFVEWLEPKDTRIDDLLYDWDLGHQARWQDGVYNTWATTQFDEHATLLDFYRTTFDAASVSEYSLTRLELILKLPTQQISGHNAIV
jgi:hypothetical protein